ncbi:MAG: GNAT family N-acetyltransferase [Rhodocyclaceae bacterium]|nr:GNAT family N-acetyltransferase [Rhodocyclaceae bacterium]
MSNFQIEILDASSPLLLESSITLLINAFSKPERYSVQRLSNELQAEDPFFYRRFFIALEDGKIIGIGGVKAADWASHTHLLYLSAVALEHRGKGVGRALVKARVDWVEKNHKCGRILVSSPKVKRLIELGFTEVRKSFVDGRHLLFRRF